MNELSDITTTQAASAGGMGLFWVLINIAIGIFYIVVMWKVFVKAGLPAWGVLIPIYNTYLMIKVAGRPGWWLVLILLPPVYFVLTIIMCIDVAKNFGKSASFGVGIIFLSLIFLSILAFDSSEYQAVEA
jgi:hypothetical protein